MVFSCNSRNEGQLDFATGIAVRASDVGCVSWVK